MLSRATDVGCQKLVSRWLTGELHSLELKPDRDDCAVYRLTSTQRPLILKLWSKPGWRGVLRRVSRTSPMRREQRALQVMADAGLAVPQVVGSCDLSGSSSRWTEALLLEDLGECTLAVQHTKQLAQRGEEEALQRFMDEVLDLTDGMLRCGIIDTDHSLQNLVATPEGRAVRLDFELARVEPFGGISDHELGLTLGHLIGSYVFAVQPEVHRAVEFAQKVQGRLKPSRAALAATSAEIERMMRAQHRAHGIDTRVTMPWD